MVRQLTLRRFRPQIELLEGRLTPTAGMLDPTYGVGGTVITPVIGTADDIGRAMTIQADGKILMAGQVSNNGKYDFGVVRYNTNGSLDTTFGSGGVVITSIDDSNDDANGIAVQADGKIVVVGDDSPGTGSSFFVVRYNTDGSLDTTFGGTGIVTTYFGSVAGANSVAIQPDGKIVVAGSVGSYGNNHLAVARYNTDGSLDNSFNGDGILLNLSASGAYNAMVFQPDGKIVLAGYVVQNSVHFTVVRLDSDGSLDSTFNGTGVVVGSNGYCYAAAIQSDGKIVAAGWDNGSFAVGRYNTDGSEDTTFGSGGYVVTSNTGYGGAMGIQASGKIVVAGFNSLSSSSEFVIARYTTAGALDTSFGTSGITTTSITGYDHAQSMAIQPDGRIVVGGYGAFGGSWRYVLARYETDGPSISAIVINQDISSLFNAAGQPSPGTQRSMVNDIVYTFSEPVNIPSSSVDPNMFMIAYAPGYTTGTGLPTLNWAPVSGSNNTQWAVTFSGNVTASGSIFDGEYVLSVTDPNAIIAQSDGHLLNLTVSGIGSASQSFYRLYGDVNGDGIVNGIDNVQFKAALTVYNAIFDFNGEGVVNAADNLKFKSNLTVNFSGFTPTI
jgi:uncharacterized delta-60 repeat protein